MSEREYEPLSCWEILALIVKVAIIFFLLSLFLSWVGYCQPAYGQGAYHGRQDPPYIRCSFAGGNRSGCEVFNVYPATPQWVISRGDDIILDQRRKVIYFDHPQRVWVEVHMDVVRSDGELIVISLALIRNGSAHYCLPLEDTHGFNLPKCKVPPQWAYELPDYEEYYAQRARHVPERSNE